MRTQRRLKLNAILDSVENGNAVQVSERSEDMVFDGSGIDLTDEPTDHGFRVIRLDEKREPPRASDVGVLVDAPPSEPIVFRRRPGPAAPKPDASHPPQENRDMAKLDAAMKGMRDVDGYVAAGIVDAASGMALASETADKSFDIEAACAANTDVVRAKLKAMDALGMSGEAIEDILITLGSQYHLIRPLKSQPSVFCYLAVDRGKANLAMSRLTLSRVESAIEL